MQLGLADLRQCRRAGVRFVLGRLATKAARVAARGSQHGHVGAFRRVLGQRPAEAQRLVVWVRQHGHQSQWRHLFLCDLTSPLRRVVPVADSTLDGQADRKEQERLSQADAGVNRAHRAKALGSTKHSSSPVSKHAFTARSISMYSRKIIASAHIRITPVPTRFPKMASVRRQKSHAGGSAISGGTINWIVIQ